MPGSKMPQVDFILIFSFDTVCHFFFFCIEVLLLIVSFSKQYSSRFFKENSVFLAISIAITYGVCIEFLQALIPGRSMEFSDVFADSVGSVAGYGMFYLIYKLEIK
jgi:VanZ family protein